MMPVKAVMAGITGHMMGCCDPVSCLEGPDRLPGSHNLSCDLMTKDYRPPACPVPVHHITAAYAAGLNTYKEFTRTYFRNRHFLYSYITAAVISCDFHFSVLSNVKFVLSKINHSQQ